MHLDNYFAHTTILFDSQSQHQLVDRHFFFLFFFFSLFWVSSSTCLHVRPPVVISLK